MTDVPRRARFMDPGINWCWYLEVEFHRESRSCVILGHYRVHKGDALDPRSMPSTEWRGFEVLKDNGTRLVYGVRVLGDDWLVENPDTIWKLPQGIVLPIDTAREG